MNTLERYMMKNLVLVDAEGVEGAEAREGDRYKNTSLITNSTPP
jgi:hypothetical protein